VNIYSRRLGVLLASLSVVLLLVPMQASANISVSGSFTHVFKAEPGQALQGAVEVVNTGDAVAGARLYITDYMYYANGTVRYGDAGTEARSNAPWVVLRSEVVSVPPKGVVTVSYYISVPAQQLRGSYWSMIMVEEVKPPHGVAPVEASGQVAVGIITRVRYGIQVITDLGEGAKDIAVTSAGLTRNEAGAAVLHLEVEGTGEARVQPRMAVWAYDGSGNNVGEFVGSRISLLPGTSGRFSTVLEGLADGDYAVLVVLEDDDVSWGVQYDLQLR